MSKSGLVAAFEISICVPRLMHRRRRKLRYRNCYAAVNWLDLFPRRVESEIVPRLGY